MIRTKKAFEDWHRRDWTRKITGEAIAADKDAHESG
jgi:hypothetical protein